MLPSSSIHQKWQAPEQLSLKLPGSFDFSEMAVSIIQKQTERGKVCRYILTLSLGLVDPEIKCALGYIQPCVPFLPHSIALRSWESSRKRWLETDLGLDSGPAR